MSQLTPDQLRQVSDAAHNNLGYDSGASMYVRKTYPYDPKRQIDDDLTRLNTPMSSDDRKNWMFDEASNFQNKSGRQLSGTLPYDSPYYRQRGQAPSAIAASENVTLRMCYASQYLENISYEAECQGNYRYSDFIDTALRTVNSMLM